jgi:4-diphosphocytidyl-2-C-methyl-D-erythritol kinase
MPSVTARAPAKVNLALAVGAPGPDGYHALATVFHAVSLVDDVVATATDAGSGPAVDVEGDGAGDVPDGTDNLAVRAAVAVAERCGVDPDVHLLIRKSIPVAAGLAGGSADAAAALVACDALWSGGLERDELAELALSLGSDVPFALLGGTAVGVGRGERLTPALARGRFEWVFAVADEGLATPTVYAELDRIRRGRVLPEPRVDDAVMSALRSGRPAALGEALCNDLQAAAVSLRPGLMRVLEAAEEYGALGSVVSGSGPTIALLARDAEHAIDLAVSLTASGVCRTVKRAHGPVPGARLVDGGRQ